MDYVGCRCKYLPNTVRQLLSINVDWRTQSGAWSEAAASSIINVSVKQIAGRQIPWEWSLRFCNASGADQSARLMKMSRPLMHALCATGIRHSRVVGRTW